MYSYNSAEIQKCSVCGYVVVYLSNFFSLFQYIFLVTNRLCRHKHMILTDLSA